MLREGWPGPAGTRIHLARSEDAEAADALMATTGDQVRIIPVLRSAIEDGTAASTMLAGLGASNTSNDSGSPTRNPKASTSHSSNSPAASSA